MINKITEADLINKGVVGLPDVPGLTTIEMQNKFEEISRDVIIPRFNELIDNTVSASDEFSKLNTYNVGDYCIYQGVLYKCTTAITTAGEWDATKWKATSIDKELVALNSNLKIKKLNVSDITSIGNHTLIDSIENYNAIIVVNSVSLHTFNNPTICINMGADTISTNRGVHIDGFVSGSYMCVYGEEFSITKNIFKLNSTKKQYFNSIQVEACEPKINIYGIK